jgi:DNA helicase-2/ATP-dependent DNA helicase PcrA
MDLLAQLNPRQREAVTTIQGPVLVLAGAGSGKTRVITHRIAHLIEQGVPPAAILAVTFTNKAADEMRERAGALLAGTGQVAADVWISTFHSFCARLLRREAARLGLPRDFTIFDEEDQTAAVKLALRQLSLDEKTHAPRSVLSRISHVKNCGMSPADVAAEGSDERARQFVRIYEAYESVLRAAHALDFDDLLVRAVELLREHPAAREAWSRRFRHLHVDEYQDTNTLQYALLRYLIGEEGNLCVVGDEDQSIYSWRGADVSHILRFADDYPSACVVRLEDNYRSRQNILDAAGAVVAHNRNRLGKTLVATRGPGAAVRFYEAQDAAGEADWVTEEIARLLREDPGAHAAVLYRTNAVSRQFEEALRRRSLRYRLVGGFSFYQRAEVKDALAYLRVARNPDDDIALLRILNTPPRGIGKTTVEALRAAARENGGSAWNAICKTLQGGTTKTAAPLREFHALVEALRADFAALAPPVDDALPAARAEAADGAINPSEFLERVMQRTAYLDYLEQQDTLGNTTRAENLRELMNALEEAQEREETLEDFLDRVALVSDADAYDARAPVSLMTLHSAKGLEFEHVFLAGLEEGLLPHSRSLDREESIEEERRLCYVGMTRAKDTLTLTRAIYRRGYGFGKDLTESPEPSRFLAEIPSELIETAQGSLADAGETRRYVPDQETLERQVLRRYPMHGTQPSRGTGDASPRSPRAARSGSSGRASRTGGHPLIGIRVRHKAYGVGTIIAVEGEDDERRLTVSFTDHGTKKLVERYASLERL